MINEEEASHVRQVFEWYLEGQPVHGIAAKCADRGWNHKQWTTTEGKTFGGHPMRKCHIYTMLANPLYAARIRADGEIVAATHLPIIDANTFDLVQQKLKENTRNPGCEHRPQAQALAPWPPLLFLLRVRDVAQLLIQQNAAVSLLRLPSDGAAEWRGMHDARGVSTGGRGSRDRERAQVRKDTGGGGGHGPCCAATANG